MTRTAPLATQRANLERAVSIFEGDRLAVMGLNLARDLLRRVIGWQASLKSYPHLADIIMGEYAMWAPLIRITIEDAERCLGCENEARAASEWLIVGEVEIDRHCCTRCAAKAQPILAKIGDPS